METKRDDNGHNLSMKAYNNTKNYYCKKKYFCVAVEWLATKKCLFVLPQYWNQQKKIEIDKNFVHVEERLKLSEFFTENDRSVKNVKIGLQFQLDSKNTHKSAFKRKAIQPNTNESQQNLY